LERTRFFLILLGAWVAGAWSLPGDASVLPSETDSSRIRASGTREMGRTLLRHRLDWFDASDLGEFRVLDTSLFRYAGDPGVWAGESFLHVGWAHRADSGWGLSWKLWNRTNGLGAPEASVAENAWRQWGMVRRVVGDSSLAGALSLGALLERVDPGSNSPGIAVYQASPEGLFGAGSWSVEGQWAGLEETPARVSGEWSDLFEGTSLRQTKTSLLGSIQASLSGEGTDTARLDLAHDSVRQRSAYLLADRTQAQRNASISWVLPIGSQNLSVAGAWNRDRFEDHSGRNPGLVKTTAGLDAAIRGGLGGGWRHAHSFQWTDEERIWKTPNTGTLLEAELQMAQDRKDRDDIAQRGLLDTIGWSTDRWGGVGIAFGVAQSLRTIRHPLNETPSSADRPDEDVSKRQFGVDLRWDRFSWNGRSLFSWSTQWQEDVYLRAVHSAQTWKRSENRLGLNFALPVVAWARPDLALWAREQRNVWRFLSDRREGLLEYGITTGGELGPAEAPWATLQWTRWQVKTGATVGEAFAPDRVQDEWLPEARGFVRWKSGWCLEPWVKLMWERVSVWDGSDWILDNRTVSRRAGADLRWEAPHGRVSASVARVWNHLEKDAWVGSIEAGLSW
jgi:hypothetical protein